MAINRTDYHEVFFRHRSMNSPRREGLLVCVPSQEGLKTLWGVGSPKHLSVTVQPSFRKHSRHFLCGRLQMCSEPLDQNIFAGEHTTEFPKWMYEGFSEHRHCK
ncbi:hypothetical protein CEXT_469701 [Caerostris extrusa]|uniref:Uncharacterized protein n=1 Tax=Caerostris extrusa TaxID=172846 RepID=A0AAV4TG27_CAEEX|nr:hypothetical protein CEXT_469701 [Caerostris extrusa]